MEKTCRFSGCDRMAEYECSCQGNLVFCESHITQHSKNKGCNYKPLKNVDLLIELKKRINATENKISDLCKQPGPIIDEINSCFRIDLSRLHNYKSQLKYLKSIGHIREALMLEMPAASSNFTKNDLNKLLRLISNYFYTDEEYPNEINESEKFRAKNKMLKVIIKENNEMILQMEKDLNKIKEAHISKQNEVKDLKAELEKASTKTKELENSVNRSRLEDQEMQNVSYRNQNDQILVKNLLDQLNNNQKEHTKAIEKKQDEIKRLCEDLNKKQHSLDQANDTIKTLNINLKAFEKMHENIPKRTRQLEAEVIKADESLKKAKKRIEELEKELGSQKQKYTELDSKVKQIKKKYVGNFKLDKFRSMNKSQQKNLLLRKNFEKFQEIEQGNQRIQEIKISDNGLLFFICKYEADCIGYKGTVK